MLSPRSLMIHAASRILLVGFLLISAARAAPQFTEASPAFSTVPELKQGFALMYEQHFAEAQGKFSAWAAQHPEEPFGQVALAASYLFEEFHVHNVLSSEFFLNDKRFLRGIEGPPDPERIRHFQEAIASTRRLAGARLKKNPHDSDGLLSLAMAAGMQSDAASILEKKDLEALKRLKEANEYAKQLLAQRPDANDAYVALGAANYLIGSLTTGERLLLWFGGIHGDKKLGMQQLQNTVNNGRYLQPFAKILLALSAEREKQYELAQKLLLELTEEFPGNPSFAAEYAKSMGRPVPALMHP
jgi:tetratricopeptide (TPR) repeat protein